MEQRFNDTKIQQALRIGMAPGAGVEVPCLSTPASSITEGTGEESLAPASHYGPRNEILSSGNITTVGPRRKSRFISNVRTIKHY